MAASATRCLFLMHYLNWRESTWVWDDNCLFLKIFLALFLDTFFCEAQNGCEREVRGVGSSKCLWGCAWLPVCMYECVCPSPTPWWYCLAHRPQSQRARRCLTCCGYHGKVRYCFCLCAKSLINLAVWMQSVCTCVTTWASATCPYFKGRDDGLNTLLWFSLFMGFQVFLSQ